MGLAEWEIIVPLFLVPSLAAEVMKTIRHNRDKRRLAKQA